MEAGQRPRSFGRRSTANAVQGSLCVVRGMSCTKQSGSMQMNRLTTSVSLLLIGVKRGSSVGGRHWLTAALRSTKDFGVKTVVSHIVCACMHIKRSKVGDRKPANNKKKPAAACGIRNEVKMANTNCAYSF